MYTYSRGADGLDGWMDGWMRVPTVNVLRRNVSYVVPR